MNITAQGLVCDDCTAAADLAGLEDTVGEGKKKAREVQLRVYSRRPRGASPLPPSRSEPIPEHLKSGGLARDVRTGY